MPLSPSFVRAQFPALERDWVFFDNAGGSQILASVVRRLEEYLVGSNVQHGASYEVSTEASARVLQATEAMARLVNAADPAEVVMGPTTTMLLRILARGFARTLQPGDEFVVTNSDHESNIGPWVELAERGAIVKTWRLNPDSFALEPADLEALLSDRTRLVAVTHTSNILGTINPIREIARLAHEHGARVCVDGVAFAPHRRVGVQALEADFYALSFYKLFGPHHAMLWGRRQHLVELPGFNHFFVADDDVPYKFQPGNVNYELSYSMLGLSDYLEAFCEAHGKSSTASEPGLPLDFAFDAFAQHEEQLAERLLDFLSHKRKVRVIGSPKAARDVRVPTISFVVDGRSSADIVSKIDPHRIGTRYGHFYAKRLIDDLGLTAQNGVVRISMVHYNTVEEVDRLTQVLDGIL